MRSRLLLAGSLAVLSSNSAVSAEPASLDRIVLRSGESLLGDLMRIHDGNLFFDSEELDELELELDLTENIEWDTEYELQLIPTDLDKTNHHVLSVVSVELFGPIDLDVAFTFDRTECPPLQADGTRPKSNDPRLSLGLGVDF